MDVSKKNYYNLSEDTLIKILDNIYNKVYVTNTNFDILYANHDSDTSKKSKYNHMEGKNIIEFFSGNSYSSLLSLVIKEKRRICMEQITTKGEKIIITSTPILNREQNIEKVVSIIQEQLKYLDLILEKDTNYNFDYKNNCSIITRSDKIKKIINTIKKVAKTNAPILIQGESGTGKTLLAKYIHNNSPRKDNPFFSINCATIPENLLESELFGYSPYAFTGASPKGKIGLISLANKGTLFLDEIGELPIILQAKLLDVVENHRFIPIGGEKAENVNIRIITATNKNLENMIKEKKFREDLFWRLSIMEVKLPSLSERKEDIVPLANYYLNIFNTKHNKTKFFSEEVIEVFLNYSWPGNIRQLRNIIERSIILNKNSKISLIDLPKGLIDSSFSSQTEKNKEFKNFDLQMEEYEETYIKKMFVKYKTSRDMAKALKVSQTKANKLINKYIHNLK